MSTATAAKKAENAYTEKMAKRLMKFSRRTLAEVMAQFPSWMVNFQILETLERGYRLQAAMKACAKAEREMAELDRLAAPVVKKVRDNLRISKAELKLLKRTSDAGKMALAATKRLRAAMDRSRAALERRGRPVSASKQPRIESGTGRP